MRQKLLTKAAVCCMLLFTCTVMAENTDISSLKNVLYISPLTVPQGTTDYTLSVKMRNETGADGYANAQGFTFYIQLPESFSFALNGDGNPDVQLSTLRTNSDQIDVFQPQIKDDGRLYVLAGVQDGDGYITGDDGEVALVHITLPENAPVGDYTIVVAEPTVSPATGGSPKKEIAAVETTLTITEPDDGRIKFDENAIALPKYTGGEKGDVLMTRTIKANQWSTIVLPFNLTRSKAKAAFGDDVEMAKFSGFIVDYGEDEENVTPLGITLNFTSYTIPAQGNLAGGTPILIKTSKDITEPLQFDDVKMTEGVKDVNTDFVLNEDFTMQGKFTGSLVKAVVPEDGLFLNNNKFYYSTGKTNIKAFRGWFELDAVLDKETDFGVKMFIGDIETKVEGISVRDAEGTIYDLSGRKVTKPKQSGVYIVNGKKAVIK